jgi:hypothetical protein
MRVGGTCVMILLTRWMIGSELKTRQVLVTVLHRNDEVGGSTVVHSPTPHGHRLHFAIASGVHGDPLRVLADVWGERRPSRGRDHGKGGGPLRFALRATRLAIRP